FMQYHVYRYVIAIDHFRNQLYIFENLLGGESSDLDRLEYLIQNKNFPEYHFKRQGGEDSNMTDEDFRNLVDKMKQHIRRGDGWQYLPPRALSTPLRCDEFHAERTQRTLHPSPYLSYYDYGDFKMYGSSPEAQLTKKKGEATIYPIDGTFSRTGDMEKDEM